MDNDLIQYRLNLIDEKLEHIRTSIEKQQKRIETMDWKQRVLIAVIAFGGGGLGATAQMIVKQMLV